MDIFDKSTDDKIRVALRSAESRERLSVVAAVTGISGGESKLREIMSGTGELSIMDRSMLYIHLEFVL